MRLTRLCGAGTVTLVVAAVTACSNSTYGGGSGGCTPTATQVCMINTAYSPTPLTVTHGTTVKWMNGDGFTHTVTNDAGSGETFDLSVGAGVTVSHQFNTAGTYNYHCTIHSTMHGAIVVN